MGALWGLLAAGLIGCADSAARAAARRMPIAHLILFTVWISLPICVLLFGLPDLSSQEARTHAAAALVGGVLHVGVLAFLYRALADGPVSVAVAAAAASVVFLIAWNVAAGEPWHFVQVIAGLGVFLAVAMTVRPERELAEAGDVRRLRRTALLGLGAGFVSSIRLFLMQVSTDGIGAGDSIVAMRFGAAAAISLAVLFAARRPARPAYRPWGILAVLVVLQCLLETGAMVALLHGSATAGRIGAAVGFAAVPAASTLAARIFLADPIGRRRGWWILVVVACVALATVADAWAPDR